MNHIVGSGAAVLVLRWDRVDDDRADDQQLARVRALPGFVGVARFAAVGDGPAEVLTVYSLADASVIDGPLDRALGDPTAGGELATYRTRSSRSTSGRPVTDSPFLYCVRARVRAGSETEMRRWLDDEHSVLQLTVDGATGYHGLEPIGGSNHFLNLWALDDPGVITSDRWDAVRLTPWRARLVPQFDRFERRVYARRADQEQA